MDKLKPLLVHRFWILTGLALLLPIVGWWLATGAMAQNYSERESSIQQSFSKVPPLAPHPNDNWTRPLNEQNMQEESKIVQTHDLLWNNQLPLMTWPENVAGTMAGIPFRGDIPDQERLLYRTSYDVELYNTWQIVNPIIDGVGVVDFPLEGIHSDNWGSSFVPPTSEQMWNSQEDIWLTRTVLQAIANVNSDAAQQLDAEIRQITTLSLHGGNRNPPQAGGGEDSTMDPTAGGTPEMTGLGGMMMGGQQRGAATASFNPAEEFGPDTDTSASGDTEAAVSPDDVTALGGGTPGGRQGDRRRRYIDEFEQYKTRGFYLEVVMDHNRVPDLLVELSNSPWPIRITRVQQVSRDNSGSSVVGATNPGPGRRSSRPRPGLGRRAPGGGALAPVRQPRRPNLGGMETGNTDANAAAMADPSLADVAISGIITIYYPPKREGMSEDGSADPGAAPSAEPGPADLTNAVPPADPAAMTDPAAADPTAVDPATGAPLPAETAAPVDPNALQTTPAPGAPAGNAGPPGNPPAAPGAAPGAAETAPTDPAGATAPPGSP